MIIRSSKSNTLTIFEYDISSPEPDDPVSESVSLIEGKNVLDLSGFAGIVSFKFAEADEKAQIKLELS